MDPSSTHAQIVAMMQQAGLPMTTANLNRAMEALARGEQLQSAPQTGGVEASIQRVMQPRALPVPPIPPEQATPQTTPMQASAAAQPIQEQITADSYLPPEDNGIPRREQRRGTLYRPQYVGDTGPAIDAQPQDISATDVGSILLMSPWLGMGAGHLAGNAINRVMMPRNIPAATRGVTQAVPQATANVAPRASTQAPQASPIEMLPQGSMKPMAEIRGATGPRYAGEAVDDFIQGGNAPVITRSNASDMKPIATVTARQSSRNSRVGGSAKQAESASPNPATFTTLKEFMKKQKYANQTTKSK